MGLGNRLNTGTQDAKAEFSEAMDTAPDRSPCHMSTAGQAHHRTLAVQCPGGLPRVGTVRTLLAQAWGTLQLTPRGPSCPPQGELWGPVGRGLLKYHHVSLLQGTFGPHASETQFPKVF